MRYFLTQSKYHGISYTFGLLRRLCRLNGHTLADSPEQADAILVSVCDVTELPVLEATRTKHPRATIIVGGHFSFWFKACALFADYVVLGQGYRFFRAKSFEEIQELPEVYHKGRDSKAQPIEANQTVEWSAAHVEQCGPRVFYYLAGVGCKNKCKFCLTSWTHLYAQNTDERIRRAGELVGKRGSLCLVSNEYRGDYGTGKIKVRDALLVDFVNDTRRTTRFVRCGLEFATERNRRLYAKDFPDETILRAIDVAGKLGVDLQFFCIGGLDRPEEWLDLIRTIPDDPRFSPRVYFKFTNLEYQMFTPMYQHRHLMQKARYLDGYWQKKFFAEVGGRMKRVRIMPIASPALAFWRMGMSSATNLQHYFTFKKLRSCRDAEKLYDALVKTKALETDYRDEVLLPYRWTAKHEASQATQSS